MKDYRDPETIELEHRRPMSKAQACDVLGVSMRTLQRRINSGDVARLEAPGMADHVRIVATPWSLDRLAKRVDDDMSSTGAPPDDMSRHVAEMAQRLDTLEQLIEERAHAFEGEGYGSESDPSSETPHVRSSGWRAWCALILMRIKVWCDALIARLAS